MIELIMGFVGFCVLATLVVVSAARLSSRMSQGGIHTVPDRALLVQEGKHGRKR